MQGRCCQRRFKDALALKPDGIFCPTALAIQAERHKRQRIIEQRYPHLRHLLGHQLLALASGAGGEDEVGHHGANHLQDSTASVMITSQNHGFAVDAATLPANVRPTRRCLTAACRHRPHRAGLQLRPRGKPGAA